MSLLLLSMMILSMIFAREPYEYGRYTSYYGEQDVSVVKIQEELFIGKEVADVRVKTLNGETQLKEFIKGKPTALLFAYYTCDTVCPITAENLYKQSKNLSKDYRYVILSFDEKDNLNTMKDFVQKNFGTTNLPDNWLVGMLSKEDIRKITQSVGYKFYYIDRDRIFIHPNVTIFLSPDGKVMRYLYGAFLRDKDISLAFVDAQREKPSVNNIVDLAILACYRYDHTRSRYVIDPTLIFAGIGILGVIGTFTLAYFYSRNKKEVHP
ncbi:SCO family protein [Hydrogenobacter sp. T-2]|uniref:SCO family protein n=1 Tax=Pampinifervens diazotrophicum TaxID=1632018 RepID=UPI002B25B8D4|nr:SCO family protein [Hydrogenobacter sp. T-2]WPM32179.1 SCO family protein [Hydrogenobacter sp. T-2]